MRNNPLTGIEEDNELLSESTRLVILAILVAVLASLYFDLFKSNKKDKQTPAAPTKGSLSGSDGGRIGLEEFRAKLAKLVVEQFRRALDDDKYPAEDFEGYFGVKMSSEFGQKVYAAWSLLRARGLLDTSQLEKSLLQGSLPELFAQLVKDHLPEMAHTVGKKLHKVPYDREMLAKLTGVNNPCTPSSGKFGGRRGIVVERVDDSTTGDAKAYRVRFRGEKALVQLKPQGLWLGLASDPE